MMMNKLRLSGLVLALLLFMAPLSANAATATSVTVTQQNVQMNFDGQALALPSGQYAFTYQSRVYIPLRFVSYALQKNVVWDGTAKKVTVSEPTSAQSVVLKEYLMNSAAAAADSASKPVTAKSIKVAPVSVKLVFDGTEKKLPEGQQVFSLDGTIYVPVRFMSEAIGTTIAWDSKTGSVIGKSKAYLEAGSGSNGSGSGENGSGNGGGETGSGSGSTGGSAGGGAMTVAEVKAATQKSLESLQSSCINSIIGLLGTTTDNAELMEKANVKLAVCDANFESAMTTAQSQLQAAGADDADIQATIAGYRSTYEKTKETYRKAAEDYLGIK